MHDTLSSPAAAVAGTLVVQLDGKPFPLPAGSSLADLVAAAGHAPEAVATAVGGDFVPRGQRASRPLGEGDAVLLFQPIVGG